MPANIGVFSTNLIMPLNPAAQPLLFPSAAGFRKGLQCRSTPPGFGEQLQLSLFFITKWNNICLQVNRVNYS
jgi:hypothetical protein